MSWALWITGPPGSGKSSLAQGASAELAAAGQPVAILELDAIRKIVTPEPTYTPSEREIVYRSLVFIARTLTSVGVPVIIDATAHRRAWRDLARASITRFAEVQLECPLDVCRERERRRSPGHAPAGIYEAAALPGATVPGVNVPYEPALAPDIVIDTVRTGAETAAARIADLALELAHQAPPAKLSVSPGWAIWIAGLPGTGKTTTTSNVAEALQARGERPVVLSIDQARRFVLAGRHATAEDDDVLHRVLVVASAVLADLGEVVIVDAAAPRRAWRALARRLIRHFAEVELVCPRDVAAKRDQAARWNPAHCAGLTAPSTEGIDTLVTYEHALAPDRVLRTDLLSPWSVAEEVLRLAERLRHAALEATKERHPVLVRDLMTRSLITVPPDSSVTDAKALMTRERIRHLLVVEDGRLKGVVTDRDIRLNLASPATSLSVWELNFLLAKLTVAQVMTKSVIAIEPDRDARDAARIMLDHKIGALPVLDGERLVGIVTETDLVRAFAQSTDTVASAGTGR